MKKKDADVQQKLITEINSGIYCVDNALLHKYLPILNNNNAQGEYYLTDIIKLAVDDGVEIVTIEPKFAFEIEGVNDRIQLANLERDFQSHQIHQLQIAGVQFADPNRVDIRGKLTCDRDVLLILIQYLSVMSIWAWACRLMRAMSLQIVILATKHTLNPTVSLMIV